MITRTYHACDVEAGDFQDLNTRLQKRLPIWVVYRPITSDYPGKWVARMHLALSSPQSTLAVITADSLEELRPALPAGLTKLARDPEDDPVIEEIWL